MTVTWRRRLLHLSFFFHVEKERKMCFATETRLTNMKGAFLFANPEEKTRLRRYAFGYVIDPEATFMG